MNPPEPPAAEASPGPLRILVADDHELIRQGICRQLESRPGWSVCAEAADGHEAVARAGEHAPDVLLLDLAMPGLDGLAVTRAVLAAHPEIAVVIVSIHHSTLLVRDLLKAGVRGFVLKSCPAEQIIDAVEAVSGGQQYISLPLALELEAERANPEPRGELSLREREVLRLIVAGRTNKVIGQALSISPKTAETHRARILRKLQLKTTSDLIRFCIRHRVVTEEELQLAEQAAR